MKTIRTKAIQLLLGFALTLGLMLGLSGPAMAQTEPQTTPTYQEVSSWQGLKNAIDNSSTANIRLTADCTCPEETPYGNPLGIGGNQNIVLDLNGKTLKRNLSALESYGNVIRVVDGGRLTLEDSSSNHSGKITGARTTDEGIGNGGVYVGQHNQYNTNTSYFIMKGGTIEDNTSNQSGGGVFVGKNGTFTMEGGTIQNNSAPYGGGVFLYDSTSAFTMNGGMIGSEDSTNGNTASSKGGGVYIKSGSVTFTMDGGTISNNNAGSGGGVFSNGPFIMNNGAVIQNNHADLGGGVTASNITMNNGTISGNTANDFGGGVYSSGTFNMKSGTIQSNIANQNGGGVYKNGGTFTLSNGTIQNNTAKNNGGGVYVISGSFIMDSTTVNGQTVSGIVSDNTAGITANEDNNAGNVEKNGYGGGVCITQRGYFTMSSGTVKDNTATGNGGGVFIDNGAGNNSDNYNPTFDMDGGTLSNNHATGNGGGVCNTGGTFNMRSATVEDQTVSGTISGNTATQNGGGVYVVDFVNQYGKHYSSTSNMTGGTIGGVEENSGNQAVNGGGVYVSTGGTFNMNSATVEGQTISGTISGNTATQNGGGVFIAEKVTEDETTYYSTFNMNDGTIGGAEENSGNQAANGGGVYVSTGGTFNMNSATVGGQTVSGTISGNTATQNGGGVFIDKNVTEGETTYDCTFNMNAGTLSGNTATENGGGVYNTGTFTMQNGAVIDKNKATANGGGVYNTSSFTMTGGTIGGVDENSGNQAANGGGVYVGKGGTITMSNGTMQSNNATNGGGVYVNGGRFTMTGGHLENNSSTQNGGGVYVNGGSFTMTGGYFDSNSATENGGGVYVTGGTFNMSGGVINNNTATENGGGVYVNGGTLTMTGGTIQVNTATNGGGVYVNGGTLTMTGGTMQSNNAENGGGVYVAGGSFDISDGRIDANTATQNGGGIYAATNIKLDGKPAITGNKVSNAANNVYLAKDVKIDVGKNLQPTQKIGVTIPKKLGIEIAVITTNANYRSNEEARADFEADNPDDAIYKTPLNTQARLRPQKPCDVTLVGGNHATPNGLTIQKDLTEPMQPVTYTANYGYQFPQSSPYYTTTKGITVQRTGQSTVTVSGEPTDDVTVTVPDAVEKSRVSHTVTFKVEHGAWDDGTTEDQTVTLTGYVDETLRLKQDQIPAVGSEPDNYYKAGNWDTEPSPDTPITEDMTYTYTYEKQAVVMPTIYFAAHVQNYGWDKKNQVLEPGKTADVGTTGQSLRVEDLAVIVPKDLKVDGYAHVQNVGDMAVKKVESTQDYTIPQDYVAYEFGTTGQSRRVEAVCISIKDPDGQYITGFQYAVHLQNYGWQGYVRNGSFAGTRGMALRMEALRFAYTKDDVVKPGEP